MKIERRKLSYNKLRDQVVTTLNAEFLREIGIEPDSHINIIYEDVNKIAIICSEKNLSPVLSNMVRLLKETKPSCDTVG